MQPSDLEAKRKLVQVQLGVLDMCLRQLPGHAWPSLKPYTTVATYLE